MKAKGYNARKEHIRRSRSIHATPRSNNSFSGNNYRSRTDNNIDMNVLKAQTTMSSRRTKITLPPMPWDDQ